jgi:hypothetical protein
MDSRSSVIREYRFAFDRSYRWPARLFGISDNNAIVTIDPAGLRARFGPWTVSTPLSNVVNATLTGPYDFLKTAGPAHLSLSDRGITLASNGQQGVFIEFADPVRGIEPTGRLRHPNLTVTVRDCKGLTEFLRRSIRIGSTPTTD